MPKKTAITLEGLSERIDDLEQRITAVESDKPESEESAEDEIKIPKPDEVAELDKAAMTALATQLGIETEGVGPKSLRALLVTAATIHHDADVDELDDEAVTELAEACGIPSGKTAKMLAALKEYLNVVKDEESEDEESEDEESDDTDEDEESDDEEEKPKKKVKVVDEDEEDEEEEEEKDEDEEEKDEDAPEFTSKQLAAYNKVAKKPAKNVEALAKLCTDDDGTAHEWGSAYVKGDTAYSCGLPLKDIKVIVDGEKIEVGKCLVTGKLYKQDDEGDLVEVEAD